MMRASSAPCGRGSKNQKFSFLNFRFSAGGGGGADKKWKGNFWFLLRRYHNYIVFYHTIVSRHNIVYTQHNNYVRFIKKISFEYEENQDTKAYVARRHMP